MCSFVGSYQYLQKAHLPFLTLGLNIVYTNYHSNAPVHIAVQILQFFKVLHLHYTPIVPICQPLKLSFYYICTKTPPCDSILSQGGVSRESQTILQKIIFFGTVLS